MTEFELFVCGNGNFVREDGLKTLMNLTETEPDFDAPLFAIKNLGVIKLFCFNSAIGIILHPQNVEWAALHAAIHFLSATNAPVYRVRYLDESWLEETVTSPHQAAALIFELCHGAGKTICFHPAQYRRILR